MSWSTLTLSTPASSALNLSHDVSVLSVTPWTHGITEGEGLHTWLSFPNAIDAVIKMLLAQPADAAFCMAVSAASMSDLAVLINTLATDFPLKQLLQWQRQAATMAALENDKFTLPAPAQHSTSMAINAVPEVKKRQQKTIAEQALADAAALKTSDPLAALTAFETDKIAHDALVNTPLPALTGGAGWRFYAAADVAAALRNGHPGHEYTLTAILAFSGSASDLAYLTEMMP